MVDLGVGTEILTRAGPHDDKGRQNGQHLYVKRIKRETHPEGVYVYNFVVDGDHTYFVGLADGGEWVHNGNCFGRGLEAAELRNYDLAQSSAYIHEQAQFGGDRNIAVVRLNNGEVYWAVNEGDGLLHSEQVLDKWLSKNGLGWGDVAELFSDRIPCARKCSVMLYNNGVADAKVTWATIGGKGSAEALRGYYKFYRVPARPAPGLQQAKY